MRGGAKSGGAGEAHVSRHHAPRTSPRRLAQHHKPRTSHHAPHTTSPHTSRHTSRHITPHPSHPTHLTPSHSTVCVTIKGGAFTTDDGKEHDTEIALAMNSSEAAEEAVASLFLCLFLVLLRLLRFWFFFSQIPIQLLAQVGRSTLLLSVFSFSSGLGGLSRIVLDSSRCLRCLCSLLWLDTDSLGPHHIFALFSPLSFSFFLPCFQTFS